MKPLNFTTSLGYGTRTARRTMVTTEPLKVAKFSLASSSVQSENQLEFGLGL